MSASSCLAFANEIGIDGIRGKDDVALEGKRVAFRYDGSSGVDGSPGMIDNAWTLPRCTLLGCRAGPSGYALYPFASVMVPSSAGSVYIRTAAAPASSAARTITPRNTSP